jgi:hypothetical protein
MSPCTYGSIPLLFKNKSSSGVGFVAFFKNHMPKKLVNLINYLDERFTTETFVRAK